MYDQNDEKIVLSIDEIRAVLNSPESWLGYIDKSHLLPWVHPANITGIDLERLIRVNRMRNYAWELEINVPETDREKLQDPDYVDDDDLVRDYLGTAISQREALAKKHPDVELISGIRHFAALLYMATQWESDFSRSNVERSRMPLDEILGCLDLYEAAFRETPHCHIKHELPDSMDSFFCNDNWPWELNTLPEFQKFLDNPANIDRLAQMRRLFAQSCPDMVARSARERAETDEAVALLDAARSKAGRVFQMPEGNALYWTPEVRTIYYFDSTVNNWFETRWLEQARAGKCSLFGWKFRLAKRRGYPIEEPITDELLNSLAEFTSDADALYYLFRHLDEGGDKYSEDTKRVLARIRELNPSAGSY